MIDKSKQSLPQNGESISEPLEVNPEGVVTPDTAEPAGECTQEVGMAAASESRAVPVATQAGGFFKGSVVLKTSHILIGALAVVLLVVGGVFFGMWLTMSQIDHEIDPNAKEYEDIFVAPDEVAPGNLSAPGYDQVTFRAGRRNVQIVLPNPAVNPCYFRFSLILPDTHETLYRSGLVPPGKAITDITLSRPLEVGTYRLEIVIEAASLEDRSTMNGITMEVVLTVE